MQMTSPPERRRRHAMLCAVDVIELATTRGFTLEERVLDRWVWGWRRGEDDRWPCFGEHRLAVSWMADRLRRGGMFER